MADGPGAPAPRHCEFKMQRRSTTIEFRMGSWLSLPLEIRLKILEALARQKPAGWTSYASVCKEWQSVIAGKNLGKLRLQESCLDDFGNAILQQRGFVRHIWLDLELPRYTCERCETFVRWNARGCHMAKKAIKQLFRILSSWEARDVVTGGLTLELNAYCPSDSDHWFKGYHFDDDEDEDGGDRACSSLASSGWHDPRHGWVNGRPATIPDMCPVFRLFEIIEPCFQDGELARVEAVTRLVLRRQMRRRLSPPALGKMLEKLCCLEHLAYEPWREWGRIWTEQANTEFLQFFQNRLPETLKSVSVFEDFDENLAWTLRMKTMRRAGCSQGKIDLFRIADRPLGEAFALASLGLEYLSVSYMIDAQHFFTGCAQSGTWERLQTLALTSPVLRPDSGHKLIRSLLCSAGEAALRMPKLRSLVLWNGAKGNACAFVYRVGWHYAYLSWRGTWALELGDEVKDVWRRVAAKSGLSDLQVQGWQRVWDVVLSHGDAIHLLDLPCQVVSPTSLWQIRREGTIPPYV